MQRTLARGCGYWVMTPGRSSSLRARRVRQPSIWQTAAENVLGQHHSDVFDDSSSAVTPAGLFLCRSTGNEFLLRHRRTPADGTDTPPAAAVVEPNPRQTLSPRVPHDFGAFSRLWPELGKRYHDTRSAL